MSQRDGFSGGFFAGAIVGGIIGGIVGAIAASRRSGNDEEEQEKKLRPDRNPQLTTEESIETARLELEDKIAQLNLAIDDVRHQLSSVNGNTVEKEQ